MTSDQVLDVLTKRMESALSEVPEIVNIESTTTGAFGAVITARNDFGVNQERLRTKIQAALDQVWFPTRQIAPPSGEDAQTFANRLLGDMTPDVLIYLAERDPNFLFQLSPEVWQALPDDTVKNSCWPTLPGKSRPAPGRKAPFAAWSSRKSFPLSKVSRRSRTFPSAAGRYCPAKAKQSRPRARCATVEAPSLLLQLTPAVWQIASTKAGISGALDDSAVQQLKATSVEVPTEPPALPASWQMDRFKARRRPERNENPDPQHRRGLQRLSKLPAKSSARSVKPTT